MIKDRSNKTQARPVHLGTARGLFGLAHRYLSWRLGRRRSFQVKLRCTYRWGLFRELQKILTLTACSFGIKSRWVTTSGSANCFLVPSANQKPSITSEVAHVAAGCFPVPLLLTGSSTSAAWQRFLQLSLKMMVSLPLRQMKLRGMQALYLRHALKVLASSQSRWYGTRGRRGNPNVDYGRLADKDQPG